jgi:Dyp-type peroxidase family
MTALPAVELEDVQGLLSFGYRDLTEACFLLVRVEDATAARARLAKLQLSNAVKGQPPDTAVHVAFTSEGLRALGVAPDVCAQFSAEFVAGMASDEARSRRLGDVGANAPCHWEWGTGARVPHVAVLLYARPGHLAGLEREIAAQCAAGFVPVARLSTSDLQEREPFGFRDGISQPELDWERRRPIVDRDQLAYGNVSCLGEFVLGYPNEYGLYTPRPLLVPQRDPDGLLPRAEDAPELADLGRNGSYLVLRQLRQDVDGFWRELERQANGDAELRERLAAAMVGRDKDGRPLATTNGDPNGFTFDDDPRGLRCPLGAHIRRSNPRTADLPPGTRGICARLRRMLGFDAAALEQDLVASTRFHRLLRRGRKYGGPATDAEVGIHFMCVAANIKRQFEFVQSAWMMGSKFAGLGERDPLLGHRVADPGQSAVDHFSIPQADGPDRRLSGLPQFVTVKGGAYFFLPGMRALRYIAGPHGKGS